MGKAVVFAVVLLGCGSSLPSPLSTRAVDPVVQLDGALCERIAPDPVKEGPCAPQFVQFLCVNPTVGFYATRPHGYPVSCFTLRLPVEDSAAFAKAHLPEWWQVADVYDECR